MDIREDGVKKAYIEPETYDLAADPVVQYMSVDQLLKNVSLLEEQMKKASKELDFIEAARLRDEMRAMEALARTRQKVSKEG